jgi:hypothetical protein
MQEQEMRRLIDFESKLGKASVERIRQEANRVFQEALAQGKVKFARNTTPTSSVACEP